MKTIFTAVAALAILAPAIAQAEEGDRNPLAGPKLGIELTRDANQIRQAGGTLDANRNGIGVRGFAGYDMAIGNMAVVGGEIGIGKGGGTSDQASLLAGGRYRVDPGLTYDATGRIGVIPATGFMIYGRGGYRWLQTKRIIADQATGNGTTKVTEKGFTYGGGLEYAVTPNVGLRAEFNRTNYDRNFKQNKISVGATVRF
jgi:outer membrane immunogenic protein